MGFQQAESASRRQSITRAAGNMARTAPSKGQLDMVESTRRLCSPPLRGVRDKFDQVGSSHAAFPTAHSGNLASAEDCSRITPARSSDSSTRATRGWAASMRLTDVAQACGRPTRKSCPRRGMHSSAPSGSAKLPESASIVAKIRCGPTGQRSRPRLLSRWRRTPLGIHRAVQARGRGQARARRSASDRFGVRLRAAQRAICA